MSLKIGNNNIGVVVKSIGGSSGDLSTEVKNAILNCFQHVAWIDEHGQEYYDILEELFFPTKTLVSISATFNQGQNIIYDNANLNDLKQYLTVTGLYDDNSTETITNYSLSGTLTVGTSTVTVTYEGKTTIFTVAVTEAQTGWVNNVYTLTTDDLTKGQIGPTYPYLNTNSTNRVSYVGVDINLTDEYTYTFEYDTNLQGTTQCAVRMLTPSGYELYQERGYILDAQYITDSGWKSSGYSWSTPNIGTYYLWFTLRINTNASIEKENFTEIRVRRETK